MGAATHLVTLSFDDGFIRSSLKQAEIYEKFGLSACINVIASGHEPDFKAPDKWHDGFPKGDFGLWNELAARGHEIMPHGYRHARKSELPFEEAKGLILRCLDIFQSKLKGFSPATAVFNYPYLATTPELDAWLCGLVRATRGSGPAINPMPSPGLKSIGCPTSGPDDCEEDISAKLEGFLAGPGGWFVYCGHGVDGEGWGPVRSAWLEALLARLVNTPGVRVFPAAKALALGDAGAFRP